MSSSYTSIFVLRNNDIGDLLVVTPIFEALRRLYPEAKLIAGVGDWNRPTLEHNPFVDEVFPMNTPWHNKQASRFPQNSWRGRLAVLNYLVFSREVRALRSRRVEVGIDVLGSPHGTLLFHRAGIRHRLGVKSYHGKGRWMNQCIDFDPECYVGRAALKFASLLGLPEEKLPSEKPQLFLTESETMAAEQTWRKYAPSGKPKLLIGFGGGYAAKCWPLENFRQLLEMIERKGDWTTLLVGGPADSDAGKRLADGLIHVTSFAGELSLRETFALTKTADAVVSNSSMLMHVAAAFEKPVLVLLGSDFPSATEHARLWLCNPRAILAGPEHHHPSIVGPQVAHKYLQELKPALNETHLSFNERGLNDKFDN